MNTRKAINGFVEDVRNAVWNALLESTHATWDDFCVQMDIPPEILQDHTLTVWGETTEDGGRAFSVYVKTKDEDIRFSLICDVTTDELEKTLVEAMERAAKLTPVGVVTGKLYLLQERRVDGSAVPTICTPGNVIRAYGFQDCTDAEYEVFEISVFGEVTKLEHEAQTQPPFNYHRFINTKTGEVAFDGFSPEH